MKLKTMTLDTAPECLNTNDKAMWLTGYNEAIAKAQGELDKFHACLEDAVDDLYAPDPNCSCHLSPPCNDCVNYSHVRATLETANTLLKAP